MFEEADKNVETDEDEEQDEAYQRQIIKVKPKTSVLLMEDYFSDPAYKEV